MNTELRTKQSKTKRTVASAYWDSVWRIRRRYWTGKLAIIGVTLPALIVAIWAGIRHSYMLLFWGVLLGAVARICLIAYWVKHGERFGIPLKVMLTHRSRFYYISELFTLGSLPAISFIFWKPNLSITLLILGVGSHYLKLYFVHRVRSQTHILILRKFGAESQEMLNKMLYPVISHVGMPITLTEQSLRPRALFGLDLSGIEQRKVENENWQKEVLSKAFNAKAIIMDIGETTPAIQWEQRLCLKEFSHKIIFIANTECQIANDLPVLSYGKVPDYFFQQQLGQALGKILTNSLNANTSTAPGGWS